MEQEIDPLFDVHILNDLGKVKARRVGEIFTEALRALETEFPLGGREGAIVRTKLEEAGFYAKKAMALQRQFQQQ